MQGGLCQKPVPADETELRFAPRSCVCSQSWGEHFLFILKIETEPLLCVSPAWGHSADNEDASVVPALGGPTAAEASYRACLLTTSREEVCLGQWPLQEISRSHVGAREQLPGLLCPEGTTRDTGKGTAVICGPVKAHE